MAFELTKDQKKIVETRDKSLLVSAAAGSGKTAVLVKRIVKLVLEDEKPCDIDSMLIVTFTKAAAGEMKERLYKAFLEAAENPALAERAGHQKMLVHQADICTIDSFCGRLVRENYTEAGISPDFIIADDGVQKIQIQEVLEEVLDAAYRQGEESFLLLADALVKRDDDSVLKGSILRLYEAAQSLPWPDKWLETLLDDYEIQSEEELFEKKWVKDILNHLKNCVESLAGETEELLEYIGENLPAKDGEQNHPYHDTVSSDLLDFEEILKAEGRDFFSAVYNRKAQTLSRKTVPGEDKQLRDKVKDKRTAINKSFKELKDYCINDPREEIKFTKSLYHMVKALVELTLEFSGLLMERKNVENGYSFSDIEHFAINLLIDKDTGEYTPQAGRIREQFSHVMVDEYQDSNLLQESLLMAVSGEPEGHFNYFMVGDVKQSIYRFRNARPAIFVGKYDSFKTGKSDGHELINLSANFRSRKAVTDCVNTVFSALMRRDLGGIEYDADNRLVFSAVRFDEDDESKKPEIYLLSKDDSVVKEAHLDSVTLEAMMVADIIEDLMESHMVSGEEGRRPIRYSDIAILHRSANKVGETFREVFNQRGIPVFVSGTKGYFNSFEINTIMSMLTVLNNPMDDIPLCGVLKNLYGFTEEDLYKVKENEIRGESPFFSKQFFDYAGLESAPEKFRKFREEFEKLRQDIIKLPLSGIIQLILKRTGFLNTLSAMETGERALANIDKLLDMAVSFEGKNAGGLYDFVTYISDLQSYDQDFGHSSMAVGDETLITTIHKSKGLEYPVCILAGCGKSLKGHENRNNLVINETYGIGMDLVDRVRGTKIRGTKRRAILRFEDLENAAENERLLYVALTRAEEKLIITGVVNGKGMDKYMEESKGGLSYTERFSAGNFLDMMIPPLKEKGYAITKITGERLIEKRARYLAGKVAEIDEKVPLKPANPRILLDMEKNFGYDYDIKSGLVLKNKYSVSEIKSLYRSSFDGDESQEESLLFGEDNGPIKEYRIPSFMEGEDISGNDALLRGTAVHRFMECLDYEGEADFQKQLDIMVDKGLLTGELAGLIPESMIKGFFNSDLYERMKKASFNGNLFREKTFVMEMDSRELFKDLEFSERETGDKTLIQGIIDAYFMEEEGFVLLDYKTDKVNNGVALRERYKSQLDMYEKALVKAYGIPVVKRYLYSFILGETVEA